MPRWATFDCYGTLIDWNLGLGRALQRLWPDGDRAALLARYHQLEPTIQQAEPTLPYREVMARCLGRLAYGRGLPLSRSDQQVLGDSLPDWPAFPEVPAALAELKRRGWRLAILSNTDPDLLAASLRHLETPFDELVIASEIGSYKPARGHWRVFRERTGARAEEHVHVGAGLFHDIRPATDLGLRTVWINRLGETADPVPTRELPDLHELPDTLDDSVIVSLRAAPPTECHASPPRQPPRDALAVLLVVGSELVPQRGLLVPGHEHVRQQQESGSV